MYQRILLSICLIGMSSPALAEPIRYYLVMFGTQSGANTDFSVLGLPQFLDAASKSHTFGTFVKVQGDRVLEEKTISWLPQMGYFGPGYTMPKLPSVPGHNYTLDQTLGFVRGKNFRH